jgi:hypothetical protein
LGRVSRTAESSLKEASLAEASEFKVPFKPERGSRGSRAISVIGDRESLMGERGESVEKCKMMNEK